VEWNPLDATHRLLLRNALVAHLQLSQLREHVGHFWTHPIRNAFLLKQDSTSNLATAAKSLRAPASGDGNATMGEADRAESHDSSSAVPEGEAGAICDGVLAISVTEIPRQDISLLDLIEKTGALPEPILGCILTQLVSIIERLHVVCGCIHNDIDARNVFVCTNSGIVRLSNYYFSQFPKRCAGSCLSAKADQKIPRFLGPLLHQAPERMLGLQCSFSSDIWSLGFLIRFCLTGELPVRPEKHQIQTLLGYKKAMVEGKLLPLKVNPREKGELAHAAGPLGKAMPRHIRKILEKTSNEWKESWKPQCSRFEKTKAPEFYSKDLSELVDECLQKNPAKRPTAVELADHPFLVRCKLAIGLSVEVKDFLKLHKQKLHGFEEQDYN